MGGVGLLSVATRWSFQKTALGLERSLGLQSGESRWLGQFLIGLDLDKWQLWDTAWAVVLPWQQQSSYQALQPAPVLSGVTWAKVSGPILFTTGTHDTGTLG